MHSTERKAQSAREAYHILMKYYFYIPVFYWHYVYDFDIL